MLSLFVSVLLLQQALGLASTGRTHHVPCMAKATKRPALFGAQILASSTAEYHNSNVTTQAGSPVVISYCEVNMYVFEISLLPNSH